MLRTATHLLNLFQQHTVRHELDLRFVCNVALISDLVRNHSVSKRQGQKAWGETENSRWDQEAASSLTKVRLGAKRRQKGHEVLEAGTDSSVTSPLGDTFSYGDKLLSLPTHHVHKAPSKK